MAERAGLPNLQQASLQALGAQGSAEALKALRRFAVTETYPSEMRTEAMRQLSFSFSKVARESAREILSNPRTPLPLAIAASVSEIRFQDALTEADRADILSRMTPVELKKIGAGAFEISSLSFDPKLQRELAERIASRDDLPEYDKISAYSALLKQGAPLSDRMRAELSSFSTESKLFLFLDAKDKSQFIPEVEGLLKSENLNINCSILSARFLKEAGSDTWKKAAQDGLQRVISAPSSSEVYFKEQLLNLFYDAKGGIARPVVETFLEGKDSIAAKAAEVMASNQMSESADKIRQRLKDVSNDSYRITMAKSLARLGDPSGTEELKRICRTAGSSRAEALGALIESDRMTGVAEVLTMANSSNRRDELLGRTLLASLWESPDSRERFLRSMKEYSNSLSEPAADSIKQYAADLESCEKIGIARPFRYSAETLSEIVKNRVAEDSGTVSSDTRPRAILVIQKSEDYGAFNTIARGLDEMARKYHLIVHEAGSDDELMHALRPGLQGQKAQLIAIAGHGRIDATMLGGKEEINSKIIPDKEVFDISDLDRFRQAGVGEALQKDGRIISISCSTGRGGPDGNNMANMLRQLFPHAKFKGILAPKLPTNIDGMGIQGGEFKVEFSSGAYQAGVNGRATTPTA